MSIFRSPLRRRVNIEILKLRMQLSEIEKQKKQTPQHHTSEIVDMIIRQKAVERDIELLKKLL